MFAAITRRKMKATLVLLEISLTRTGCSRSDPPEQAWLGHTTLEARLIQLLEGQSVRSQSVRIDSRSSQTHPSSGMIDTELTT